MPKRAAAISGDFDQMADQIYNLHQDAGMEALVSYKNCDFTLNFMTGTIEQLLQTHGAVHSQVSRNLAVSYVSEIKIAHSLAADISLLENIKSIKDNVLKHRVTDLIHSQLHSRASIILSLLESNAQTSTLQLIGLFKNRPAASSPALEAVRTVLHSIDFTQIDTIGKADKVWDQIQSTLANKVTSQRTQKI